MCGTSLCVISLLIITHMLPPKNMAMLYKKKENAAHTEMCPQLFETVMNNFETALCAILLASSQDFFGYLPEFQREVGVETSILHI